MARRHHYAVHAGIECGAPTVAGEFHHTGVTAIHLDEAQVIRSGLGWKSTDIDIKFDGILDILGTVPR